MEFVADKVINWLKGYIGRYSKQELSEVVLFVDGSNAINKWTSAIEKYLERKLEIGDLRIVESDDLYVYNAMGVNITPAVKFFEWLSRLIRRYGYPFQVVVVLDIWGKDTKLEKLYGEYKKDRLSRGLKVARFYEFEKFDLDEKLKEALSKTGGDLEATAGVLRKEYLAYFQRLYESLKSDKAILLGILRREYPHLAKNRRALEILYRKVRAKVEAQINKLIVCEILKQTPVKCLMFPNVEGDTVLAYALRQFQQTWGRWIKNPRLKYVVVSNDTDFYQLVGGGVSQLVEKTTKYGDKVEMETPAVGVLGLDILSFDHKAFTSGAISKRLKRMKELKGNPQLLAKIERWAIYRYFTEVAGVPFPNPKNIKPDQFPTNAKQLIDQTIEQQKLLAEKLERFEIETRTTAGVSFLALIKTVLGDRTDYIKGIKGIGYQTVVNYLLQLDLETLRGLLTDTDNPVRGFLQHILTWSYKNSKPTSKLLKDDFETLIQDPDFWDTLLTTHYLIELYNLQIVSSKLPPPVRVQILAQIGINPTVIDQHLQIFDQMDISQLPLPQLSFPTKPQTFDLKTLQVVASSLL